MQDDDGRLVRAMTATMKELLDDSEFDPAYFARSALAAIEREGWVILPKSALQEQGREIAKLRQMWDEYRNASPKQG